MPPVPKPIAFIFGEDEHSVKQHARQLFQLWCAESAGLDHEIIDAHAANSSEALRALGRLREALQTLPFFGSSKVVWFKNCSFLGDDRTATTQAVTENLNTLADDLKSTPWDSLRLILSAGKVDRRRSFFKSLSKIASVEPFEPLSLDDRDWAEKAARFASQTFDSLNKSIAPEALAELVQRAGPNPRLLQTEAEKAALHAGDNPRVSLDDVRAVALRNRQSQAFAMAEAIGDRDLPRLIAALEDELWETRRDSKKSEIGLLYGVIAKIRSLLILKELVNAGYLKAGGDYQRFKSQIALVPQALLPADRRFNPLSSHPFAVFKGVEQSRHYRSDELLRAMDLLLDCNRKLVSTDLDERLVLQQALIRIVAQA